MERSEDAKLRQIENGAAVRCRKRVYRELDNRLLRLKTQLENGSKTTMEYLDAIGHCLKLS